MKALILIGGLGTRLRPLTCHVPKPLIPVVNKPFLNYQFELLKRFGIKDIILCISYLPESFKKHFGTGKKQGLKISYVYEKHPLGTGGAVKNAEHLINGPVLVLNGDVLTDIPLARMIQFHKRQKAGVTIALTEVKDPTAYGLIKTEHKGRITQFLEKPSWDEVTCHTINAGTYIFQPEILRFIPEGVKYSLERGLFPLLLEHNIPMFGFVYDTYWLDMGTTSTYLKAHADILTGALACGVPGKQIKKNIWTGRGVMISSSAELTNAVVVGDHTRIGDHVRISGPVSIGAHCSIGRNAVLEQCVILDSCIIGEGARLTHCIAGNNCTIEPYAVLDKGVVLGSKSRIKRYSKL